MVILPDLKGRVVIINSDMRGRLAMTPWTQFVAALFLATMVSIGLLAVDDIINRSFVENYLFINLLLAWVPLGLAFWLQKCLQRKLWSSWEGLILSALWLIFLPNTFYMISDFIHLVEVNSQQLLYSAVMFTSFIYTGVLLGFSSLYIIHQEFRKRFSVRSTTIAIGLILLSCSFAIYIGRDLRWNTWDIATDPAGLIFEISTRLLHPSQYPQVLSVITPFFVLLASMYMVAQRGMTLLKLDKG
jgi:uncharacterized membrane protein